MLGDVRKNKIVKAQNRYKEAGNSATARQAGEPLSAFPVQPGGLEREADDI